MSVVNTLNIAVACLRQKGPSPITANDVIAATEKVERMAGALQFAVNASPAEFAAAQQRARAALVEYCQ
jgi:hypothetical protein